MSTPHQNKTYPLNASGDNTWPINSFYIKQRYKSLKKISYFHSTGRRSWGCGSIIEGAPGETETTAEVESNFRQARKC